MRDELLRYIMCTRDEEIRVYNIMVKCMGMHDIVYEI